MYVMFLFHHRKGAAYYTDHRTLLEINTLPGLTKHSLVPKIAENNGINFDKLVSMIIKDALI